MIKNDSEDFLIKILDGSQIQLDKTKNRFVLGRKPSCDIVFNSSHVSRVHCEISRLPPNGTLIIRHLSNLNSTCVDNEKLTLDTNDTAVLTNGALIGLGVPTNLESKHYANSEFIVLKVCQQYSVNDLVVPKKEEKDLEVIDLVNEEEEDAPIKCPGGSSFSKYNDKIGLKESPCIENEHTKNSNISQSETKPTSTNHYCKPSKRLEPSNAEFLQKPGHSKEKKTAVTDKALIHKPNNGLAKSIEQSKEHQIPAEFLFSNDDDEKLLLETEIKFESISYDENLCTNENSTSAESTRSKTNSIVNNFSPNADLNYITIDSSDEDDKENCLLNDELNSKLIKPLNPNASTSTKLVKSINYSFPDRLQSAKRKNVDDSTEMVNKHMKVDVTYKIPLSKIRSESVASNISENIKYDAINNIHQDDHFAVDFQNVNSEQKSLKNTSSCDNSLQNFKTKELSVPLRRLSSATLNKWKFKHGTEILKEDTNPLAPSNSNLKCPLRLEANNLLPTFLSESKNYDNISNTLKNDSRLFMPQSLSKSSRTKPNIKNTIDDYPAINDSAKKAYNSNNDAPVIPKFSQNFKSSKNTSTISDSNEMLYVPVKDLKPKSKDFKESKQVTTNTNSESLLEISKNESEEIRNHINSNISELEHQLPKIEQFNKLDFSKNEKVLDQKENEHIFTIPSVAIKQELIIEEMANYDESDLLSYSQIDDVIYLSSDDEGDPIPSAEIEPEVSSPNEREGSEMNSSYFENFNDLFSSDNEEPEIDINADKSSDLSMKPKMENSSFNSKKVEKTISQDTDLEPSKDNESDDNSWWPVLSQGFYDECTSKTTFDSTSTIKKLEEHTQANKEICDSLSYGKETGSNVVPFEDENRTCLSISTEKNKKGKTNKSILLDHTPPPHKRKSLKNNIAYPKRSLTSKSSVPSPSASKAQPSASKAQPSASKAQPSASKAQPSHSKVVKQFARTYKKPKCSLRKKLSKNLGLAPYKSIAKSLSTKPCHTLATNNDLILPGSSKTDSYRKKSPGQCSSNQNKNNSITTKSTIIDSVKLKGKAKINSTSRGQKLHEINIFPPVNLAHAKCKSQSTYKVPKKSKDALLRETKSDPKSVVMKPNELSSCVTFSRQPKEVSETAIEPKKTSSILKTSTELQPISRPIKKVSFAYVLCQFKSIPARSLEDTSYFGPLVQQKELFYHPPNPFEFIYIVCNWNCDWLKAYRNVQDEYRKQYKRLPPPPNVTGKVDGKLLMPTLTSYRTFKDYKDVFGSLMYYEAWEGVYKHWKEYIKVSITFKCQVDTPYSIERIDIERKQLQFFVFKLIFPVCHNLLDHNKQPAQGSLVKFTSGMDSKRFSMFGYVRGTTRSKRNHIPNELKGLCQGKEDTIISLEVLFTKKKYIEGVIRPGLLGSISNVAYIKPSLKTFEALCFLPQSLFCPFILNPDITKVFEGFGQVKDYLVNEIQLNEVQKEAVIKISDKCLYNLSEPKLSLIHGPPGTGKTRVISALSSQIITLFKQGSIPGRRILVCAPSNAAVDELTLRFVKLREQNIFLNVVRVGVRRSISPAVEEFFYDTKVNKEYNRLQIPKNKSVEEEIAKKINFVEKAEKDLKKAEQENRPKEEIKLLKQRRDNVIRSKNDFIESCQQRLNAKEKKELFKEARKKVLMTAEIITCTLGSCSSGVIDEVFGQNNCSFACCIIDEAGQCTETDVLMTLRLGIKKLILVGDHMQLPATVLSVLAQGKNLHQSMFERFYHHLTYNINKPDLINSLTQQYRMHEEICIWPSTHFYNRKLTSIRASEDANYQFKPYVVFDVQNSQELSHNQGELYNMTEVLAIRCLLEHFSKKLPHYSIGVLTPYHQQRIYLNEILQPFYSNFSTKPIVSTIDNFQGQERDIIICSFVRANSHSKLGFVSDRQRMNVALTRAKKSLFIFGHLNSLQSNSDWDSLISNARHRNLVCPITSENTNWTKFITKNVDSL